MFTEHDQQQRIQDHYEDPFHRGTCARASHFAEAQNPPCPVGSGDVVVVELRVASGLVAEVWFDGDGCTLSQAVASMLAEKVTSMPVDDVTQLDLDAALRLIGLDVETERRPCCQTSLNALTLALASPLNEDHQGPSFAGPDLGDEC